MRLFSILLLIPFYIYPQEMVQGVVLDEETKKPLEFVDVYTKENNTLTNADGKYELELSADSIHFNLIGYEKLSKSMKRNHTFLDTIYMKSKFYELDEVVVTNKALSLRDFIRVGKNYPFEPYTESFFMRASLKRNNSIIKLQDISGLIWRKQLLATGKQPRSKNNIKVHVANMRKASVKEDDIYFEMFGLEDIDKVFSSIAVSPKYFYIESNLSEDGTKNKLMFKAKSNYWNPSANGHYVIDAKDMAIEEYYFIEDKPDKEFTQKRGVKYRNVFYEVNVHYVKDKETALYYMDKAKLNAKVEVYDGDNPDPIMYDASYVWFGLNLIKTDKIQENVSKTKDILKLDYPYDETFWNNQKFLLLTDEMKSFINELQSNNSKNEYTTNMD